MISDLNRITQLVIESLANYENAITARKNLNYQEVFSYCRFALESIALTSYILAKQEERTISEALNWVKELPIPNGLYPMLIKAVEELTSYNFSFLDFILSYPTATKNIYLIRDSLEELLDNITKKDDDDAFTELIRNWKKRL